ncbi:MAG: YwiC-like family protein [Acidobacteriota bacterium]
MRRTDPKPKVPIPHEHGAWAVLYSSFLVGWAATGRLHLTVIFLLTATTSLFLAHEPLIKLIRARKYGARLLVCAFRFNISWLPLLGFLPILGRGFWHAFRSEGSLNLRRIGYLEVLYTILFTILMGAGVLVDGF